MNYKLIRMKRKSLTISVSSDGEVTVKAPLSTDASYIDDFIVRKSAWIEKKLAEYARRSAVLGGVTDYSQVMLDGVICGIAVSDRHKKVCIENGVVYIPVKYGERDARIRAVAAWYKRGAQTLLSERLGQISAAIGLSYASFRLTNAKSKWGSCDSLCNIRLNWRLVMLDGAIVDYVIVHELSHTVHHNHSADFWALVQKFCPDYKQRRKRLKTYTPLTAIYR